MSKTDIKQAESFLVVRLGAIGDVLRVCPAVARLRKARPNAKIAWAVEHWVAPLVKQCPFIDRLHILDRNQLYGGWFKAMKEIQRLTQEIRACKYDVALDFHGRLKSGIITWLSGAPMRVGYAKGQSTEQNHLFTNRHVRLDDPQENRVQLFLDLLKPLGIASEFNIDEIGIVLPEGESIAARNWYIEAGEPDLAVYVGSSINQSTYHRWPMEKWIELLRRIGDENISSVLFWGPDEEVLTRQIATRVGMRCSLAPKTGLTEMMAMLGQFPAFIGGNTAAMHMSWMQGVPVVYFPGPANPKTDGPLDPIPGFPLRADHLVRNGISKRYQSEVTTAVTIEDAFSAVLKSLGKLSPFKNHLELGLQKDSPKNYFQERGR